MVFVYGSFPPKQQRSPCCVLKVWVFVPKTKISQLNMKTTKGFMRKTFTLVFQFVSVALKGVRIHPPPQTPGFGTLGLIQSTLEWGPTNLRYGPPTFGKQRK